MSQLLFHLGWLGYAGDEKLSSCVIGITICQYKDPVINQPGFNGMSQGFLITAHMLDTWIFISIGVLPHHHRAQPSRHSTR